jgi:hypothetical protein
LALSAIDQAIAAEAERAEDAEPSKRARLLRDILAVTKGQDDSDILPPAKLSESLRLHDRAAWGGYGPYPQLTPEGLGRDLASLGLGKVRQRQADGSRPNGYRVGDVRATAMVHGIGDDRREGYTPAWADPHP